jgi:hypothetical protein
MDCHVTKEECLKRHEELIEKLDGIERRLFVDNGSPSIQTRLERHDLVIRALLWVVSVAAGTAIAGAVSACVVLLRFVSKIGG